MDAGRNPERTCVACRSKADKRDLLRIVRMPDGTVVIDPSGAVSGRGAYLHRTSACVEAALRRHALGHALRKALRPGEVGRLRDEIERELERR